MQMLVIAIVMLCWSRSSPAADATPETVLCPAPTAPTLREHVTRCAACYLLAARDAPELEAVHRRRLDALSLRLIKSTSLADDRATLAALATLAPSAACAAPRS